MGRQTDKQTNKQTDIYLIKLISVWCTIAYISNVVVLACILTEKPTFKKTNIQTDTQADGQTDRRTDMA